MNKILLLILAFLSLESLALTPKTLTCSKQGTDIYLVNGISYSRGNVKEILIDQIIPSLQDPNTSNNPTFSRLDKKDPAGKFVNFGVSYNNTRGFLRDLLEASAQKISISFNVPLKDAFVAAYFFAYQGVLSVDFISKLISTKNLSFTDVYNLLTATFSSEQTQQMIKNEFNQLVSDTTLLKKNISTSLLSDRKVILISESQGNLFVGSAIKDFQNGEQLRDGTITGDYNDYTKFISNVQIATPADSLVQKNKVVLNDEDIIRVVFFDSPASTFNNFEDPDNDPRPSVDHFLDHFIWSTYLNFYEVSSGSLPALKEFTLQSIIDSAADLESNCGHPPVARFEYKSRAYAVDPIAPDPMIYDFDGSISTDEDIQDPSNPNPVPEPPDFDIVSFEWLIEGTTTLTGMNPTFTFSSEGPHSVQLIVTDAQGNKSEPRIIPINVTNLNPTPGFTTTVDGLKVNFNATTSTDDGRIVDYAWNFGMDF